MKPVLSLICIVLILLALGPANPARADVAPPPPPAGANVYPGKESTQVRMVSETVVISAAQNEPGEPPYARVKATFNMLNEGDQEENLAVRFPLNFLAPDYMSDWETCDYPLAYPEISDFTALVAGQPVQVNKTTRKIADPGGVKGTREVACWASFPVVFSPGKPVKIEVDYTAQGYPGVYGVNQYIQFNYVLVSGKGWKGTIGSADIIFQAPYPLNPMNRLPYFPENGMVNGSEIRWHFSDFEPDFNINVAMMDPGHWKLILDQVRQVTDHPQDGEAWGKLALAYKQAILLPIGWRADEPGYEMYAESATAYAKAIALRPNDANLRYEDAELLIWNAFYPSFGRAEDVQAGLVRGVEQLKRALEINPNHLRANSLLKRLAGWTDAPRKVVDLSGARPNYLILTPGGITNTPVPTLTRTPFPASLTPSPTWTPNPTRTPTITPTVTQTYTPFPTRLAAQPEKTPTQAKGGTGMCGAALLPGIALVISGWQQMKKRVKQE